jgi:hypothetical protein
MPDDKTNETLPSASIGEQNDSPGPKRASRSTGRVAAVLAAAGSNVKNA